MPQKNQTTTKKRRNRCTPFRQVWVKGKQHGLLDPADLGTNSVCVSWCKVIKSPLKSQFCCKQNEDTGTMPFSIPWGLEKMYIKHTFKDSRNCISV